MTQEGQLMVVKRYLFVEHAANKYPIKTRTSSTCFAHLWDVYPLLYKEAIKTKETSTRPTSSTHTDHKQPTLQSVIEHGMHCDPTVMPKLKEIEYFLATTDFWISPANHSHLSCTIHFVDKVES